MKPGAITMYRRLILSILFFPLFFFVAAMPVFAQCTSPSGLESQTRYAANKLYYCGDGEWREVPGGSASTGAGCVVGDVYVPGGQDHIFFTAATHANCASISQSRSCTNGVLSGNPTYLHAHCAPLVNDTTPDAFSFNDVTGANVGALTTPSPASITITGINASTNVTVSGDGSPQIRIGTGSWGTMGSITNGQTLAVRLTASAATNATHTAVINVGGVTDNWSVTTSNNDIVNGVHTSAQCTAAGGTVFTSGAIKICRFNSATCPSGWTNYLNWTTTTARSCNTSPVSPCCGNGTSCTTGSHAFSNSAALETCQYEPTCRKWNGDSVCIATYATCTATRTQRGCY